MVRVVVEESELLRAEVASAKQGLGYARIILFEVLSSASILDLESVVLTAVETNL